MSTWHLRGNRLSAFAIAVAPILGACDRPGSHVQPTSSPTTNMGVAPGSIATGAPDERDVCECDVEQLATAILALPPWRASRRLTADEVALYLAIARDIQRCPDDVVERALAVVVERSELTEFDGDYAAGMQAFVLNCIVYDVPEFTVRREPAGGDSEVLGTNLSARTYRISPVVVRNGKVADVVAWGEDGGGPHKFFSGLADYKALRHRWPLRNLSQ